MSDQDMFNQENKEQEVTPEQKETPSSSTDDIFADKLKKIVNERGEPKYKDVDTALEALNASQQFIETLKQEKSQADQELEQAKAKLEQMGNIDDFVKRVSPNAKAKEEEPTSPTTNSLSEERVQALLQEQFDRREQESRKASNLSEVTKKLSEVHGDKAAAFLKTKAEELGTTIEGLKELSSTNPKMALALLGSPASNKPKPSQPSSVNLPLNTDGDNVRPQFEKGTTRGGLTSKEMTERWKQSAAFTNKRIGLDN